jgi:hypothetical protein
VCDKSCIGQQHHITHRGQDMRTLAAVCAACTFAGCAIAPRSDGPQEAVRTRPPEHWQATVSDYFDIMMPAVSQRRLAFGTLEPSGCALYGPGGRHQGWMVPVIYDTSVAAGDKAGGKTSSAGTGAATGKPAATTVKDGTVTATLQDVKISGKGYFFWFSSDTIAAVTRRADCPP